MHSRNESMVLKIDETDEPVRLSVQFLLLLYVYVYTLSLYRLWMGFSYFLEFEGDL